MRTYLLYGRSKLLYIWNEHTTRRTFPVLSFLNVLLFEIMHPLHAGSTTLAVTGSARHLRKVAKSTAYFACPFCRFET